MAETMNMTKKRLQLIKDNAQLRKDILGLNDQISALTNENSELESKVNGWEDMQAQGYTAVILDEEGMIVNMVNVALRSKFIYTQDIPRQIGTALYDKISFYKLDENGTVVKDTQKYNRYINI